MTKMLCCPIHNVEANVEIKKLLCYSGYIECETFYCEECKKHYYRFMNYDMKDILYSNGISYYSMSKSINDYSNIKRINQINTIQSASTEISPFQMSKKAKRKFNKYIEDAYCAYSNVVKLPTKQSIAVLAERIDQIKRRTNENYDYIVFNSIFKEMRKIKNMNFRSFCHVLFKDYQRNMRINVIDSLTFTTDIEDPDYQNIVTNSLIHQINIRKYNDYVNAISHEKSNKSNYNTNVGKYCNTNYRQIDFKGKGIKKIEQEKFQEYFALFYYSFKKYEKNQSSINRQFVKKYYLMLCNSLNLICDDMILANILSEARSRNYSVDAIQFFKIIESSILKNKPNDGFDVQIDFQQVYENRMKCEEILNNFLTSQNISEKKTIREKNNALTKQHNKQNATNTQTIKQEYPTQWDFNTLIQNKEPIYVIGGNTKCQREGHPIITLKALVREERTHGEVVIPIQQCKVCRYYFIGLEELKLQEEKYGKLYFNSKKGSPFDGNFEIDTASILMKHGYTVNSKDDFSDDTRQRILSSIIKEGYISKSAVMQMLEHFITYNGKRWGNEEAKKKWQDDLDYLASCDDTGTFIHGVLTARNKR